MSDGPALCHTAKLIVAVLGQSGLARSVGWVDLQDFMQHRIQDRHLDRSELARDRQALLTLIARNGNSETIDLVERELYHQPGIRDILLTLLKSGQEGPIRTLHEFLENIETGPAEWPSVPFPWLAPPPLKGHASQGDHDDVDKYLHRPSATYDFNDTEKEQRKHPITAHQLAKLRDNLYGTNHPVDLFSVNRKRINQRLLGGIMIESIWATGLRPSEWPGSRVLLGNPGDKFLVTTRLAEKLKESPPPGDILSKTFKLGLLGKMEEVLTHPAIWLDTLSSKTTNRYNPVSERRLIGLVNLPLSTRVTIFILVSFARFYQDNTKKWDTIRRKSCEQVTKLGRLVLPEIPKVNYAQLRHDFSDRARTSMDRHEHAYVMGHSSLGTQHQYGRPAGGRGTLHRQQEPTVFAPPEEVEKFRFILDQRKVKKPADSPQPEASIHPSPTPMNEE